MLAIGSDHGGYDLKQKIIGYLKEKEILFEDMGCYSTDSCDYPQFGRAVADAVAGGQCEKGIVICTTGIGISIAANKVKGIRCALCADPLSAIMMPTCWRWAAACLGRIWPWTLWTPF